MSQSHETFNVTIGASMDVSGVLGAVKQMQGAFNGLKLPPSISADMIKDFNKLQEALKKFDTIAKQDHFSKADLKSLDKLQKEIDTTFSRLTDSFNDLKGQKFYLEADYTAIKNAQAEIDKLKSDVKTKLSEIKINFTGANGGIKSLGLDEMIQGMERGVKSSKVLSAAMAEVKQSFQAGNFDSATAQLSQIVTKANDLKGAGSGLLNLFKQWGIVDFSKPAIELVKTSEGARLLREGLSKIIPEANADSAAIKKLADDIVAATNRKHELEQIGQNNIANMAKEGAGAMEQLGSAAQRATGDSRQLASSINDTANQIKQLQQSTQYFFSLRNMINLLKRGVREAVDTVKELDAAMTKTAVVTDFSVGDMWKKLPEYTANANALGATVKDMYEATTLYYQQGLDSKQSMEIAAETMKMARIGGLEAADATDKMTAALRGFNMELNEASAQRVNDVYSNLAAKTASDTEELGTAMQRTASIAASAGMSFEGTAAFLAQAIETTREPAENLGTAMKTIVARFTELKKNPLEISEVDGEEVDYNKVDTALKSIGVSLKDTNGQFRDLDQVFLDISQRWDGLTQTQQRYIATTAAGSRQQSRFIAMMSNYERTMQLMDYANNSSGASAEQFGKTLESLEAKLNKFENAWKKFLMGIMNDSWTKGIVDAGTAVLNTVTKIIDVLSFGGRAKGIKSALSLFTAFTALKGAGRLANRMIGGLGGLIDPTSSFGQGFKMAGIGQGKTTAQAKAFSQPIVNSLSKISGQIAAIARGQGIKNQSNISGNKEERVTTKADYTLARQSFDKLSKANGFKMEEASKIFSGLDAQHQLSLFNNNPGTKKAIQQTTLQWFNSKGLSKELTTAGQGYINAIYKGMSKGQIPVDKGLELIGNPQKWGSHFGTETAKNISQSIRSQINKQEVVEGAWSRLGMKLAAPETRKGFLEDSENVKKYNAALKESLTAHLGSSKAEGAVSNLGQLANVVGAVGDKFTQAGYGISAFGSILAQLGGPIGAVGSGLMGLGSIVSNLGMAVSGVTSLFTLFGEGITVGELTIAGSTIASFIAPLAAAGVALFAAHKYIQKIQKDGEKVTSTFNETGKTAEDNIAKLQSYKEELAVLSKGVDANGNNINLDDSQYQRYLEIADSIAEINPSIVKGYNAQGHAIIDNNKALDETLKKQQKLQKDIYDTYTSEESLNKLIKARNVDKGYRGRFFSSRVDQKNNGFSSGFTNQASYIAKQLQLKTTINKDKDFFKKYGIDSLNDVASGEEQAVKQFVKHREQIQADLANSGIELSDSIVKGFNKLGENVDAFEEAIKPIYDNLLTQVSKSNLFESLAPEMQEAFKLGLKDIASKDLTAKEMQQAVNYLGVSFQNAFDKAKPLLDDADKALNTFAQDLEEAKYNDAAADIAAKFRALKAEAEALGQVEVAEWYENQASQIENAIGNATETIAENIDTLSDNIATAKTNFDALGEGISDYYSLADQARGLVETALEDKNTEGIGSKTFWNTYRGLASKESYEEHDLDTAISNMKQFKEYFAEGAEGSAAFAQKMIELQDKSFKITGKNGELVDAQLKDFFELAEDGTMKVKDAFTDLTDEQYAQLASVFDLSADGFTAVLNKLRQFGDLDFTDVKGIRKALALDDRTVKTSQKVEVEGEDNVKRLYYGQSMLEAEMADQTPEQKENIINDLKVQGAVQLPSGADNLLKATSERGGKDEGSLLRQFVADTKGTNNQVENVMKALVQSGEYNKEDLEKIHTELTTRDDLLANATDSKKSFDELYDGITESLDNPMMAETNSQLGHISSAVDTIAGIVAAGKIEEGYLPEVAKQSDLLHDELVGAKGVMDTWQQRFSLGQDEKGNTITDENTYKATRDNLLEQQKINQEYLASLQKGREAATSPEQQAAFDEEITKAQQNAQLIAQFLEEGAQAWQEQQAAAKQANDISTNATNLINELNQVKQGDKEGLSQIDNIVRTAFDGLQNLNLTTEQKQTEVASVLQSVASKLQESNWTPEQIQGYFKDNFGIELELKGNEFATDVGKQIQEQISNLGETKINAILNITSVNVGGAAAKGKNNTPSAIRRVGTMARGSKRGYTINGEPTLTGELGPELVWEPKQNTAYMVGEHGPQFASLSKNAVVWNAKQTKQIKKNSKGVNSLGTGARGIHSFGTMAGGNAGVGGMKIPGTFTIDANANILEVKPPTPEPEIPVNAKLEVENGGGGLLSKLFGGNKGPSIDVAANITSINSTEQQKTVDMIGNITKLENKSTLNDVDATATVTQVVKSGQIAGEPISVKAVATATQVKNATPQQTQPQAQSQTMKVSADTSAAQAKINQLTNIFNRTYTLKYRASGPSSIRVPISANFTGSWTKTVRINRSGAKGINNHIAHHYGPSFGSAATGRYGTIGPNNKGGLTLTGEKGYEIAWLPSENRSMVLGVDGPQMLKLPNDAVIYTHEQSKKILNQKAIPAGSHAGTTARGSNIFKYLNVNSVGSSSVSGSGGSRGSAQSSGSGSGSDEKKKSQQISHFSIYEIIRFDNDQYLAVLSSEISKRTKSIEKSLKKIGVQANSIRSTIQQQVAALEQVKKNNQDNLNAYKNEINDFLSQQALATWTDSEGESQERKFDIRSFIGQANGTYAIDWKAIQNTASSREEREAIYKELQPIKNLTDGLIKAQEAIDDANEQIEKLGEQLAQQFYNWKSELTEIYDLSQRITDQESLRSRFTSQINLELSKLSAGFGTATEAIEHMTAARERDNKTVLKQIENQQVMIAARQRELNRALDVSDELATLNAYKNRGYSTASEKNAAVAWAQGEYDAARIALQYVKNIKKDRDGSVQYTIDWAAFDRQQAANPYSKDTYDKIKEYLDNLNSAAEEFNNSIKEQTETIAQLYDDLKEYQDFIGSFEDTLIKTIESDIEQQLENAKRLSDSITAALKDLLDQVKRKLDERRQAEDNAKTEADIAKKQQRLAMLQANSAGGNQVEIAQLQKEIADAQQSYQRTLEDQLLNKLQQQGDDAAKQREHQIELQKAQLDVEKETNKELVNLWLSNPEEYKNEIRDAWLEAQGYEDKGIAGQAVLESEFESEFAKLGLAIEETNYKNNFKDISGDTSTLVSLLTKLTNGEDKETDPLSKAVGALQDATKRNIESLEFGKITQSASAWRNEGITAKSLKSWNYGFQELKNSGFTNAELKNAGFSLTEFQQNGITNAAELRNAGYSAAELKAAGYTPEQLRAAGYSEEEIRGRAAILWENLQNIVKNMSTNATSGQALGAEITDVAKAHQGNHQLSIGKWDASIDSLGRVVWSDGKGNIRYYNPADGKVTIEKFNEEAFRIHAGAYKPNNNQDVYHAGRKGGQGFYGNTWQEYYEALHAMYPKRYPVAYYATGGLANYTGPAWLDGTPSKPELVLNAQDTKNFLALKDVLRGAMNSIGSVKSSSYGDMTYEININVDHINNDYDVDRIAERVKKNIVKDASYRNVTQVRNFR